jgi:hypothetical protein
MKENQNDAEKKIRKVNIIKYIMDALVAHNDFSGKQFSL